MLDLSLSMFSTSMTSYTHVYKCMTVCVLRVDSFIHDSKV